MASIRPADVQALVAAQATAQTTRKRARSPKSVNNQLTLLHRVFQVAKTWGFVRENPCADIEPSRVETREMNYHTREEAGKLLQTATGDAKVVIALAPLCGLPRGEIAGLTWPAIDWDRGWIHIKTSLVKRTRKGAAAHGGERLLLKEPKSEAGHRVVDMVPPVRDALELHCLGATPNRLNLILAHPDEAPYDPGYFTTAFYARAWQAAGVQVFRLRDCRHTRTALRLASGSTDVKYLQRQMGHSTIQMTLDTYGHLFQEASARETDRLQAEVEKILPEAKGEVQ